MQASVGDRVVVHSRKVGQAERHGEVVEVVRSSQPSEPAKLRVRWSDGHEALLAPGPDLAVQPRAD